MENEEKVNLTKYRSLFVSVIIFVIVIVIVSIITFNRVKTIEIDETQITVQVNEDYFIDYSLNGLKSDQLIWRSTNEEIASVDTKGNVTGVSEGKTMIYVSDDEYIKAIIEVNVLNREESE